MKNKRGFIKKSVILGLMVCIMIQHITVFAGDFKSEKLNSITVKGVKDLGAPITTVQTLGLDIATRENGDNIIYGAVTGAPAKFFVYNIDTNETEKVFELKADDGAASKIVYAVDIDSKGIVNIITQSNSIYYRYNPTDDTLKSYGKVGDETAVMHKGAFDLKNNYYFGTYPNAKLIKYDVYEDKLIEVANLAPNEKYVRSVASYKNKIFFAGQGPSSSLKVYDADTGEVKSIKPPVDESIESYYTLSSEGGFLFVRAKHKSAYSKYSNWVYDIENQKWWDEIGPINHLHISKMYEGYVYFPLYRLGKRSVYKYNPKTKELIECFDCDYTGYFINPKPVKLKDQEKYPGVTYIFGANQSGIGYLNLQTKTLDIIDADIPTDVQNIRTIKAGYNNDIILSAYMGEKFVIYDTEQKKVRKEEPLQQAESIAVIDGNYYFGMYGRGRLFEYDLKSPPKELANMGNEIQDRALTTIDADKYIVWGTVPDYGHLGGAVGIYSKFLKMPIAKVKDVVPNQSIGGLAYKEGKIYGSTHIWGGLGIDPVVEPAKLFKMDVKNGNVELVATPQFDSGTKYFIGSLTVAPDGTIWGIHSSSIFSIDPKTLNVTKEIKILNNINDNPNSARFLPYVSEWNEDGLLFTNVGGYPGIFDPDTEEFFRIYDKRTNGLTIGKDKNVYIINNTTTRLLEITLEYEDIPKREIKKSKKTIQVRNSFGSTARDFRL